MDKKWGKYALVLAAVSAVVGVCAFIFKKKKSASEEEDEFLDSFEDTDFDLDKDLEPIKDRDYISLDN